MSSKTDAIDWQSLVDRHHALVEYHRSKPGWGDQAEAIFEDIADAIVSPRRRAWHNHLGIRIQDSGIFYQGHRLCQLSLHRVGPLLSDNIPASVPAEIEQVRAGAHLYGGLLVPHFGHFIMESLARLWALTKVSGLESVVYVAGEGIPIRPTKEGVAEVFLPAHIEEMAALLGLPPLTVVHGRAVQFERLIVPSQIFGFTQPQGHEAFHDFIHRLRAVTDHATSPTHIYVSRRKIAETGAGGILCEEVIEENLRNYGFEVVYPEELSVERQLQTYNKATKLVFAEGSATHLFGLVAQAGQSAAIVKRRYQGISAIVQIRGFGAGKVDEIDCITTHALRAGVAPALAANRALAALDLECLGQRLEELGYIPDRSKWRAPTEEEWQHHLDQG